MLRNDEYILFIEFYEGGCTCIFKISVEKISYGGVEGCLLTLIMVELIVYKYFSKKSLFIKYGINLYKIWYKSL